MLDKWTIEERIKKDDAAVIQALQGATVVQIKNYIKAAGDNNSSGCQAALLEYMHQNFEAFDPLAEYLLDEDWFGSNNIYYKSWLSESAEDVLDAVAVDEEEMDRVYQMRW